MVQFSAKVDRPKLLSLLQSSGHNGIYLTPRAWDGKVLDTWAVVWTTADKAETIRLALSLKQQAGLVRSKNRFGVRVASEHFEAAFRQLKPAQDVPEQEQVAVHHFFKISPLPPGADSGSIVLWGRGLGWKLKVLKALGPQQWLIGAATPALEGVSHLQRCRHPRPASTPAHSCSPCRPSWPPRAWTGPALAISPYRRRTTHGTPLIHGRTI